MFQNLKSQQLKGVQKLEKCVEKLVKGEIKKCVKNLDNKCVQKLEKWVHKLEKAVRKTSNRWPKPEICVQKLENDNKKMLREHLKSLVFVE